jgi:hypothetical protein
MAAVRRRRRRVATTLLAVALIAGVSWLPAGSGPASVAAQVTVTPTTSGRPLPAGFLGFSLEYNAIHAYLGRSPRALNPVFLALVRGLNPGQAPVLRIGGDSTDHTWWPLPGLIEPVGVSYTLTPDWLATVHAAAAALGARLILGVNLAADNPQLAAAEARALISGIGGAYVDALEIGNEPDVYARFAWYRTRTGQVGFARGRGWNEAAFSAEFDRWAAALPSVPLAGPAEAYSTWMAHLSAFLATAPRLGVVTFHRYPLRGCGTEATGSLAPTIAHLLDAASSRGLAASVAPFARIAHRDGLPLRVDELNSASCGGRAGVSDTFAAALWVLDTLFAMARAGVDGVNLHTLPGAAYAPFRFADRDGHWSATVSPLYYGMLLFSRAFPPGARLLSTRSHPGALRVWATRGPHGTVRTVLINDSATTALRVRLTLPASVRGPLALQRLTAPSLSARGGVRLGGVAFSPGTRSGHLPAPFLTRLALRHGQVTVTVAPASAVLATG